MIRVYLIGYRILLFDPFISFLSLQLNEFPGNKAELSSIQKITLITAIADEKIISVFCVSGGIVLPTSVDC